MGNKKIRISDSLYEQLQKLAEKSNRSMRELAEEAIKAYLLGTEQIDKPVKAVTGKIIPLQYPSRCKFCGREIKAGELAYWAKYTFTDNSTRSYVVCLDCYYKDTALAEWYLKKKKLENVVRGLKKKADNLVKEIEKLEVQYNVLMVKKESMDLWKDFRNVLLGTDQSIMVEKIDVFMDRLNELFDRISSVEASLHSIHGSEKPRSRSREISGEIHRYGVRKSWL